jgi:hypothetical protein
LIGCDAAEMWSSLRLPNPPDPGRELMPTQAPLASQSPDKPGLGRLDFPAGAMQALRQLL